MEDSVNHVMKDVENAEKLIRTNVQNVERPTSPTRLGQHVFRNVQEDTMEMTKTSHVIYVMTNVILALEVQVSVHIVIRQKITKSYPMEIASFNVK
jgi:hypothetical protein